MEIKEIFIKSGINVGIQIAAFIGLLVIGMIATYFTGNSEYPYTVAALLLTAFLVINVIISLFLPSWWIYTGISFVGILIAFFAATGFSAILASVLGEKTGEAAMVFVLPMMAYPVVVGASGVIKLIIFLVKQASR